MSEQIRSFIAFDIENDAILQEIGAIQEQLKELNLDLKFVLPQNIHVTLRFLGNIRLDMADKVYDLMRSVDFLPFHIQLCGLGVFPSLNYPRVVWIAIAQGSEQLKNIFNQLEPRIRSLGFQSDSYGFSPHLTIARVRSGRNKQQLAEFVKGKMQHELGTFQVSCLRLKKSQLSPRGPIYSTLKEYCPKG